MTKSLMTGVLVGVLMVFGPSFCVAATHQAPPKAHETEQCRLASAAIDNALKEMSLLTMEGIQDNSAPRATMRAAQSSNLQSQIQNNILLMRSYGCAPYAQPITDNVYLVPAIKCMTARKNEEAAALRSQLGLPTSDSAKAPDTTSEELCDQSKWTLQN